MWDILGDIGGAIGDAISGIPKLLSGAIGSLSPLIAGGASMLGAADQRAWSADQAQKQMDFQERMSSTAWQRGVADMKAAGINPMLSFMQGGASSPAGAIGQSTDVVGPAVSSAMQAIQMEKQLRLVDEQITKTNAEARSAGSDAMVKAAQARALTGPGSGAPASLQDEMYRAALEQAKAGAAQASSAANLNRLNAPATSVTGSKAAGFIKALMGSGGFGSAIGALGAAGIP